MPDRQEIARPWFGRALAGFTIVIAVVATVAMWADRGAARGLRLAPWTVLVALATWAAFWRPHVALDDAGVHVVNVLRTIHVPWASITDIGTRWALTLVTAQGTFLAWAAPASDVSAALRQGNPPAAEPADAAAAVVRRRWQQLQEAGRLEEVRLEMDRAPTEWHVGTMVALAVLTAACVITLLV